MIDLKKPNLFVVMLIADLRFEIYSIIVPIFWFNNQGQLKVFVGDFLQGFIETMVVIYLSEKFQGYSIKYLFRKNLLLPDYI